MSQVEGEKNIVDYIFFVLEYIDGGDLMLHIMNRERCTEEKAGFFILLSFCSINWEDIMKRSNCGTNASNFDSQFTDQSIALSELKKLVCRGSSMECNFRQQTRGFRGFAFSYGF